MVMMAVTMMMMMMMMMNRHVSCIVMISQVAIFGDDAGVVSA